MDFSQVLDLMGEAIVSGKLEFPIITVLVGANGVVAISRNDGTNETEILWESSPGSLAKKPINFYLTDPRGQSLHAVVTKKEVKWFN